MTDLRHRHPAVAQLQAELQAHELPAREVEAATILATHLVGQDTPCRVDFDRLRAAAMDGRLASLESAPLDADITTLACTLETTPTPVVRAVLIYPELLQRDALIIRRCVVMHADAIGMPVAQLVPHLLKVPRLIFRPVEELTIRVGYAVQLARALGEPDDPAFILDKLPMTLVCTTEYLHTRYMLAKLGLARGALVTVSKIPKREAEQRLLRHFANRMRVTGNGQRALQVMHARGLITALPPGVPQRAPRSHDYT